MTQHAYRSLGSVVRELQELCSPQNCADALSAKGIEGLRQIYARIVGAEVGPIFRIELDLAQRDWEAKDLLEFELLGPEGGFSKAGDSAKRLDQYMTHIQELIGRDLQGSEKAIIGGIAGAGSVFRRIHSVLTHPAYQKLPGMKEVEDTPIMIDDSAQE